MCNQKGLFDGNDSFIYIPSILHGKKCTLKEMSVDAVFSHLRKWCVLEAHMLPKEPSRHDTENQLVNLVQTRRNYTQKTSWKVSLSLSITLLARFLLIVKRSLLNRERK